MNHQDTKNTKKESSADGRRWTQMRTDLSSICVHLRHLRIFLALLFFVFLVSWWFVLPAPAAPRTARGPKLVVILVIDQFRQDFLTRFAPFFGEGGFRRLTERGSNFTDAHYGHAATYTGPGHACIVTGTYGYKNGIIANNWYNRARKQREAMIYDPESQLLDGGPTTPADETSPRNLIGTALGDQLMLANGGQSRVIALSVKDRAAEMLGGKMGKAYWFSERLGEMTSSTYYGRQIPSWLREFNTRQMPNAAFGKNWERVLPESAYRISRRDDFPSESDVKGLGRTFPHPVNGKLSAPGPDFYTAFTYTPWANDYQFAVARAAIEAENLGRGPYPDLLGISLTAQDYVGHAFGPESQEAQDLVVRTDRQLAEFLTYLTSRFAAEELLIAFTADHGGCPIPEYMASLGIDAGRIKSADVQATVEQALDARFGAGDWVLAADDPSVYLNRDEMARKNLQPAEVERAAGEAALTIHGMASYFTRSALMAGEPSSTPLARQVARSFHPERSGDVMLVTRPYYFWGRYANQDTGTTHGSPYAYDTQVPLVLFGSGIRPATHRGRVEIADLAPTLAALLQINPPSGSDGRVLTEALAAEVSSERR
jgi:predicted AlkP superfamily pyrophosphatase or phosphodiesterase